MAELIVLFGRIMNIYREDKLAPTLIVFAVGGAALAKMLWSIGIPIFTKWYFYPSFAFWLFSLLCVVTGRARSWDPGMWKICQWWSGIWSLVYVFCFVPPWLGAGFMSIALDGGVNPFLAGFVHVMIWACVTDILKPSEPTHQDPMTQEAEQDVHGNTH
jgi:hypothetical protein